jgi:hypothetical protein
MLTFIHHMFVHAMKPIQSVELHHAKATWSSRKSLTSLDALVLMQSILVMASFPKTSNLHEQLLMRVLYSPSIA